LLKSNEIIETNPDEMSDGMRKLTLWLLLQEANDLLEKLTKNSKPKYVHPYNWSTLISNKYLSLLILITLPKCILQRNGKRRRYINMKLLDVSKWGKAFF
jgi:hypothetical protein